MKNTTKKLVIVVSCLALIGLAACNKKSEQKPMENKTDLASNPFMAASTLPYLASDFTKIKNSDFALGFKPVINILHGEINCSIFPIIFKNP